MDGVRGPDMAAEGAILDVLGVGAAKWKVLRENGYSTVQQLARSKVTELKEIEGIGETIALKVIGAAQEATGIGAPRKASEVYRIYNEETRTLTSGSKAIDTLLGGGFKAGKSYEIAGRNGHGKCADADTPVMLADGTTKRLGDIVKGDMVASMNEASGEVVPDLVIAKIVSGTKCVLNIKTRAGRTLRVTPEHRVLTQRGWVLAGHLSTADYVVHAVGLEPEPTTNVLLSEVTLAAIWQADGNKQPGCLIFTKTENSTLIQVVREAAESLGLTLNRISGEGRWSVTGEENGYSVLLKLGIYGQRTDSIRIPVDVLRGSTRTLAHYLNILFSCDGGVEQSSVVYSTASKWMAYDIIHALSRFGINAALIEGVGKLYGVEKKPYYRIAVGGKANLDTFRNFIGLAETRKALALNEIGLVEGGSSNPFSTVPVDAIPDQEVVTQLVSSRSHHHTVFSKQMVQRAKPDLMPKNVSWLRIINIEDGGLVETVDIETKTNHNFLAAGGLVIHNSQIVSQVIANTLSPEVVGGWNGTALLIDTENTSEPLSKRIREFLLGNKVLEDEVDAILSRCDMIKCPNSESQVTVMRRLLEENKRYDTIVIDGLMTKFRAEFIGRGNLAERQGILSDHLDDCNVYSEMHKSLVVFTNQVSDSPELYGGTNAIGGNIVGHSSKYRLFVRKAGKGNKRVLRLDKSADLPDGEAVFILTSEGLADTTEKDKDA